MQWILTILIATAATALFVAGCDSGEDRQAGNDAHADHAHEDHEGHSHDHAAPPQDASAVQPLGAGEKAPTAKLRGPDGQSVDLAAKYALKPTVLIFYRGGWCPYCNTHLGQIATAEPELLRMGYQVLAISPDRPEELAKTLDEQELTYELLSDSDVALARAFGLVFHVDDPTVEKYRGFGIDLEHRRIDYRPVRRTTRRWRGRGGGGSVRRRGRPGRCPYPNPAAECPCRPCLRRLLPCR